MLFSIFYTLEEQGTRVRVPRGQTFILRPRSHVWEQIEAVSFEFQVHMYMRTTGVYPSLRFDGMCVLKFQSPRALSRQTAVRGCGSRNHGQDSSRVGGGRGVASGGSESFPPKYYLLCFRHGAFRVARPDLFSGLITTRPFVRFKGDCRGDWPKSAGGTETPRVPKWLKCRQHIVLTLVR